MRPFSYWAHDADLKRRPYLTYELAREERTGVGAYLIEYFYDAASNHLRTVRDGAEATTYCDAANQITRKVGPNGTVNFAYDADGNLSSETAPDGSGKSYSFDGRDQLVAVEVKNAGGALFHRSEFGYDAFGRLVKSSEFERSGTAWVKQSERGRVFDGMDTVQERGESNQVLVQLTRDGNIGGILSRKAGANTSFFGYDGNGNVTTLSDAQGNTVGHYRYDGFGNTLDVSGSVGQENEHRFSTKELHAPSGLYYYGFRFYSPALGRWINRDPIGEMGGVNLYQMVGNNPVNFFDPTGLVRIELHWRNVFEHKDVPLGADIAATISLGPIWNPIKASGAHGTHAYLLVWETDSKGSKVGAPRYFAGYRGDGMGNGDDLRARYGYYTGGKDGSPDWEYRRGGKQASEARGSLLITSSKDNCMPASSVIKRFKEVASRINKEGRSYPKGGVGINSNSVANTYLQRGLGLDVTSKLPSNAGLLSWGKLVY